MPRKIPLADSKILYGRAAGRCSFPGCRKNLILENGSDKTKQIGKMAHIVAHSRNGPRADRSYPSELIDRYDNLILLCGTHHDIVDVAENRYSITCLKEMKNDHEAWVNNSLVTEVMNVGFAELELATLAIVSSTSTSENETFILTPPKDKIEQNNLTQSTQNLLTMGLMRSRDVGEYVLEQSKLDIDYPDRLKAGFRKEYDRLVGENIHSDALFESMLTFASGNSSDFSRQAAGLAILAHLFEICEVFEH